MQGRPMTGNRGSAFGMQTPVPQVDFFSCSYSTLLYLQLELRVLFFVYIFFLREF